MLEKTLKSLPSHAGVYKFFDERDNLLYVGKAKVLKNRLKSYFRFTPTLLPAKNLSPRIKKMITEAKRLEYILASNEYDALILENSLIKKLKPKYNILLRDDKTYPYIVLDMRTDFPRFEITRKIQNDPKIKYFGPFSSGARDILNALYLCYKLVQKKSCISGKKVCLYYQIDRCYGPCEAKITKKEYAKIVQEARAAIVDRKKLLEKIDSKMFQAAQMLNFEEAATLRDMRRGIENTLHVVQLDLAKIENFDLLCVYIEKNIASFMYLFIREGKVISNINKITKNSIEFDLDELYKRALLQFYKTNFEQMPKIIYTAHEFEGKTDIELYFKEKFAKNITIKTPQRGDKLSLCKMALENAKERLKNYKTSSQDALLYEIQDFFSLRNLPIRIEAFDNSHLGGSAPVGSMITYEEKFIKSDYRLYNLQAKDEYAQMKEMLERRISKFNENPAPDLWIIDGGKTLLDLASTLLKKANVYIDIIAIAKEKRDAKAYRAKGKAQDILYTKELDYKLSGYDKKLQFIQKLRDETHRFAIKSHRNKKRKEDIQSDLANIPQIGPATIKKLISFFGSFENIYKASQKEIEELIGKNKSLILFDYLNR